MARRPALTARTADPLLLYQLAVQAPEQDAAQFARWFARRHGRSLQSLREDFCGSAAIAAASLRLLPELRAVGIDADAATIAWAQTHTSAALPEADRARLRLICADVRRVRARADLILATNFSYCVFHARAELLAYLRHCKRCLTPEGYVALDTWGGGLTHRNFAERHRHRGFAHVWEQRAFDPLTHRVDCRIHFEFDDGTSQRDAFVYDWRMWTVPELRDLLVEAGLPDVRVLWRGADGVLRERTKVAADPTWICYVAGGSGG